MHIQCLFGKPVSIHCKTLFRLALPYRPRCVQAILRFRVGCHNLPWEWPGYLARSLVRVTKGLPTLSHRLARQMNVTLYLSVKTCMQHIQYTNSRLFRQHAGTMVHFMCQADLHGLAVLYRLFDAYYIPIPERRQASNQT